MNILLVFPGFIIAFIIVLYYERKIRNLSAKIRNLSAKPKNKVHFYVARDKDGKLWLYIGEPIRANTAFVSVLNIDLTHRNFQCLGLNKNDYDSLKWEDEPVEVFLNMEE